MLKTMLFDLGNVLVHFCHDRMCRQIGEVLGLAGTDVRERLIGTGVLWDFERGRLSEAAMLTAAADVCGRVVCRDALARACSDIFTLNEPMLPILGRLQDDGLRLVLLSNTSPWHVEWIRGRWPILDRFDELVLSYDVGAIKPEGAIYEAALRAIDCAPHECFYTDDIAAYVARGREFGLDAELFTDAETLRGQLAARGVTVCVEGRPPSIRRTAGAFVLGSSRRRDRLTGKRTRRQNPAKRISCASSGPARRVPESAVRPATTQGPDRRTSGPRVRGPVGARDRASEKRPRGTAPPCGGVPGCRVAGEPSPTRGRTRRPRCN
ncbi:MAG: HAD family phosphatase [Planctomyces sp.]|nr:HAD family phosphatase [Planctomyces sp.]